MSEFILVRGARQLVTLSGPSGPRRGAAMRELSIIQDGALLIHEGKIREVGPTRRVEMLKDARKAYEIDATGKIVLPGFIDCHTHLICGPPRLNDYEMTLSGMAPGGLMATVKAVRGFSAQRLELEARRQLRQFLRHGTITLEAKSGLGLDETTELRSLRVLKNLDGKPLAVVPSYFGAHACPPEFDGRPADYLDWVRARMLPLVRRRRLARFADVHCGPAAFTEEQARAYLEAASGLGFQLRLHCGAGSADAAVRLAIEFGAASVDGLRQASPPAISALACSDTVAVLLPGESFHSGTGLYAPARTLIDQGAAVALATGFDSSTSPTCSLPMILSIACSQMRIAPAEAITAATINPAHALGLASHTGSLNYKKDADFLVMNIPDYREIPFHFGMNALAMAFRRGVQIHPRIAAL